MQMRLICMDLASSIATIFENRGCFSLLQIRADQDIFDASLTPFCAATLSRSSTVCNGFLL